MKVDTNMPAIAIMNDIEALISEMDNNPDMSPWVVRLILKSIKDKAKKMATQSPTKPIALLESSIEPFIHNQSMAMPQVAVLQMR
jgi:hypothetical protein